MDLDNSSTRPTRKRLFVDQVLSSGVRGSLFYPGPTRFGGFSSFSITPASIHGDSLNRSNLNESSSLCSSSVYPSSASNVVIKRSKPSEHNQSATARRILEELEALSAPSKKNLFEVTENNNTIYGTVAAKTTSRTYTPYMDAYNRYRRRRFRPLVGPPPLPQPSSDSQASQDRYANKFPKPFLNVQSRAESSLLHHSREDILAPSHKRGRFQDRLESTRYDLGATATDLHQPGNTVISNGVATSSQFHFTRPIASRFLLDSSSRRSSLASSSGDAFDFRRPSALSPSSVTVRFPSLWCCPTCLTENFVSNKICQSCHEPRVDEDDRPMLREPKLAQSNDVPVCSKGETTQVTTASSSHKSISGIASQVTNAPSVIVSTANNVANKEKTIIHHSFPSNEPSAMFPKRTVPSDSLDDISCKTTMEDGRENVPAVAVPKSNIQWPISSTQESGFPSKDTTAPVMFSFGSAPSFSFASTSGATPTAPVAIFSSAGKEKSLSSTEVLSLSLPKVSSAPAAGLLSSSESAKSSLLTTSSTDSVVIRPNFFTSFAANPSKTTELLELVKAPTVTTSQAPAAFKFTTPSATELHSISVAPSMSSGSLLPNSSSSSQSLATGSFSSSISKNAPLSGMFAFSTSTSGSSVSSVANSTSSSTLTAPPPSVFQFGKAPTDTGASASQPLHKSASSGVFVFGGSSKVPESSDSSAGLSKSQSSHGLFNFGSSNEESTTSPLTSLAAVSNANEVKSNVSSSMFSFSSGAPNKEISTAGTTPARSQPFTFTALQPAATTTSVAPFSFAGKLTAPAAASLATPLGTAVPSMFGFSTTPAPPAASSMFSSPHTTVSSTIPAPTVPSVFGFSVSTAPLAVSSAAPGSIFGFSTTAIAAPVSAFSISAPAPPTAGFSFSAQSTVTPSFAFSAQPPAPTQASRFSFSPAVSTTQAMATSETATAGFPSRSNVFAFGAGSTSGTNNSSSLNNGAAAAGGFTSTGFSFPPGSSTLGAFGGSSFTPAAGSLGLDSSKGFGFGVTAAAPITNSIFNGANANSTPTFNFSQGGGSEPANNNIFASGGMANSNAANRVIKKARRRR